MSNTHETNHEELNERRITVGGTTTYAMRVDLMKRMFDKLESLGKQKSNDYATESDDLKNFRTGATALGLDPKQYLIALQQKHTGSINQAIMEGKPLNESLVERILDRVAYDILLLCLMEENAGHALL